MSGGEPVFLCLQLHIDVLCQHTVHLQENPTFYFEVLMSALHWSSTATKTIRETGTLKFSEEPKYGSFSEKETWC